ncbi:hypothetical protein V495_04484 [Pseudogymnoascus sp. VKM F-4514 (FW-929)]|nr:hypothetical protein V490_04126 [Pseudogymnoascus sp. VKM F-3557]KFY42495.1 hypothetical protein V495_04484 [Pseudogymnoascus sp. VKM F-4514 (FW-929)]KFY54715.1 hypothetical protein V497_07493 [Pseudogymnoascus sp. VKM F-4516 (FW-969)]
MSGYESDESMGPAPLTPGLSETHSMQASACNSEDRSPSPERSPKRRRTYNPSEPRPNGDNTHMAPAASPPGHPTASVFVPRIPVRSWTTPIPGSHPSSMPNPGLRCSTIAASGLPSSIIPAPGSPRSFGQSREFLPLILSRGLFYNRARNPCPPTALALAAERYSRVPAFPRLRILDWRQRLNSWPQMSKSQTDVDLDTCAAALRRTLSSTW